MPDTLINLIKYTFWYTTLHTPWLLPRLGTISALSQFKLSPEVRQSGPVSLEVRFNSRLGNQTRLMSRLGCRTGRANRQKKTHLLYDHELQETNMLYKATFMSTSSPMGIPPSWFPTPAAGYTHSIHTPFPILPLSRSYTTAFLHFGTYRRLCVPSAVFLSWKWVSKQEK